jgi:hypothetical protein
MIKEFTLGGIKWTIKEDESKLDELNLLGLCEFPLSLISIYHKGIDKKLVEQTIYHEVVHAILESIGENELSANDKFVQNFALLLHQFEITKK